MTAAPAAFVRPIRILDAARLVNGVTSVVTDREVGEAARDVKRDAQALGRSTVRLGKAAARAWTGALATPTL